MYYIASETNHVFQKKKKNRTEKIEMYSKSWVFQGFFISEMEGTKKWKNNAMPQLIARSVFGIHILSDVTS